MKLNNITKFFGIVGIALAVASCTDEEPKYIPAPAVELPSAYFSMEDADEIVLDETVTTYEVPVYRAEGKGEVTVPLSFSIEPASNGVSVPSSVTFTDGETETYITVTVKPDEITPNADYELSLKLADGENSPYALQSVTYPLIYESWIVMTGTDKNGNVVDKGLYRDDLIAPLYNLDPVEYEVTIQHHPESESIIRIVDPYGEAWPYSEPGTYDSSKHHYMYFNISEPDFVYMCDKNGTPLGYRGSDKFFHTGLTLDADGEIYITSFFNYYLSLNNSGYANYAGKLSQGNITYGEREMLVSFEKISTSLYYANNNSMFRIILPGYEPYVDPATVWNVIGEGQFTDGMLYPLLTDETEDLPTYSVPVAQFGGDPNMYRIMNPWKAGICPYGADYTGDKYIQLDCTNPDLVVMSLQSSGLSFTGLGTLYFMNFGAYYLQNGYTAQQIIDAGYNDTFKNGVISSAAGNTLYGFPNESGNISIQQGDAAWQLVMPNATAQVAPKANAGSFAGTAPLKLKSHKLNPVFEINAPIFMESAKTLKR